MIPADPNKPYDIKELIEKIVDEGDFFEVQPELRRKHRSWHGADGGPDGRYRRQSADGAGRVLDIDSASARQPGSCASWTASNIPLYPAWTCRASFPARHQEFNGIIKHGAKLLFAYAEATVPKVTVITRKAYGGAYDVMSSKHLRGDVNYAWPNAEIAVMGAKGAVEIIFRQDIGDEEKIKARTDEYAAAFANPFVAAAAVISTTSSAPTTPALASAAA